ncbi:Crp/Fnr family transcriptional regulator [Rhizobium sp. TRM95111]|uniref:Crp/Fnr family transcriptional regulator n=1 Tax=Rhizobium alarense TaxID=2846851 RepID=UPI001F42745E|nr:Crp/Fnr family transcriptional regulator [Rhizobium alarense]MCF3641449.1 Crp/Fnr family transcriptional regulator [Rhizobium alarense]
MNRILRLGIRERDVLMQSPLFSRLGVESLALLMEMAVLSSIQPRQALFREGEPAEQLICVLAGYVRVFRLDAAGREADVQIYGAGDLVGASIVPPGRPYPLNAQAAEGGMIARFETRRLMEAAGQRPDIALALAHLLADQLGTSLRTIADDRLHTAPQRVARYLLENCAADGREASFRLPFQKSLLAGKLGLAPEALSRAFSMLRQYGVNVRGRLIQIADKEALRRVC